MNNENEKNNKILVNPIKEVEKPKKISFLEFLNKLSPGKYLRIGLEDIKKARSGGLIVVDCDGLKGLFEGGFKVNCKFTSQRLAELAKMDGGIIVSRDLKKILFANVLLTPDTRIPTNETGTRHKAAERTAVQAETPVIAVSQRRSKITLYYDNRKYTLQDAEALLRRATENLHILEKQKEIFNELLINLNVLEMTNLVSVGDVCSLLQRIEMIFRIMSNLKRSIIELGSEGVIIQMRVRELVKGLEKIFELILRDYSIRPSSTKRLLASINFEGLLDTSALAKILFESGLDSNISSRGHRLLGKLDLNQRELSMLINSFGNLTEIFNANENQLRTILKSRAQEFKKELDNLKEQILVGKKI